MRRFAVAASSLLLLACADATDGPVTAPLTVSASQDAGGPLNFQTHLDGDAEVPARATLAQGNAKFQLQKDGETMCYKLIATNIENAFMAHIHLGPADGTGGIVVWLRPAAAPGVPDGLQGRHDGVFAEGSFTSANFVGALAGRSMEDLLAAIRAGNAYVNVHTRNLAIPAAQLEAGNFPGGEVRGQIDHGNGM